MRKIRIIRLSLLLIIIVSSVAVMVGVCLSPQTKGKLEESVTIFAASDRHGSDDNLIDILKVADDDVIYNIKYSVLAGDTFNYNFMQNNMGTEPPELKDGEEGFNPGEGEGKVNPGTEENPEGNPGGEGNPGDDINPALEDEEDYDLSKINTVISETLDDDIGCYYTYGTHDKDDTSDYFTGPIDLGSAYLYGISYYQVTDVDLATTSSCEFINWINSINDSKPILVVSHVPLHQRRNDNFGGLYWVKALNEAGLKHNILFIWGHNHTGENEEDLNAYFMEKDSSMYVYGVSDAIPINFTYMNAGYLRNGYGSVIKMYNNGSIIINRYDTEGLCGKYYINSLKNERPVDINKKYLK